MMQLSVLVNHLDVAITYVPETSRQCSNVTSSIPAEVVLTALVEQERSTRTQQVIGQSPRRPTTGRPALVRDLGRSIKTALTAPAN
jgi:hypothetical protein